MTQDRRPSRSRGTRIVIALGTLLAGLAAVSGIAGRQHAEADLARTTDAATVPSVSTARAIRGPAEEEIVLPGTMQAEYDTPIYARTSRYIRRWVTDIGVRPHATGGRLRALHGLFTG